MVLLLYQTYFIRRKARKRAEQKLKIFEGLIRKLSFQEKITEGELFNLAQNPSTRNILFGILEAYNKTDLFPQEYFTAEKGAESFLVNWLEFPTELNSSPDEIELFTKIILEEERKELEYFVFKYRNLPSPEASQAEVWMLGVSGPYEIHSHPFDIPLRVFSRFKELGTVPALEEARWVHEHISRK